jgi:serine/threonine protein kinase
MLCASCGAANEAGAAVCFTCRAVLTPLTRGSVLGARYEVLRLLGRGGMGAVYEARDRMLDETVALKVLRPELAADEELVRRFRSEIRLARKVAHANVARIYEYGEGDGLRWIAMELVDGTTLKDRVRQQGPLPPEEALDLVAQIGQGLQAIHAAGIVHRDLKAANIMVDRQGRVRVMDFGIAKAGEGSSTGGYTVGTPEYMSPEQGRGRTVDHRADVYSLGVVAYELFTGDVPFRGENAVATLMMHVEQEPPLRAPGAARLPPAVVPVLERALAKEPAARFLGVQEFLSAWPLSPTAEVHDTIEVRPRTKRRLAVAAAVLIAVPVALLALRDRREPATVAPSVPPPTSTLAAEVAPARDPVPVRRTELRRPAPVTATPSPAASAPAIVAEVSPVAPATTIPAPAPSPTATPEQPAVEEQRGALFVAARPWAWVAVDGVHVGETPFRAIPLVPGPHDVELRYPSYKPFRRRVVIKAGETYTLRHDWSSMGVRQAP